MCDVSVPKTVPEVCHHPCRFQSSLVSQASKPGYHAIVIHVGTPRKGTITSITSMACVFLHFAFLTEGDDVDRGETRHYCHYRAKESGGNLRPSRSIGQRRIRDERLSESKRTGEGKRKHDRGGVR